MGITRKPIFSALVAALLLSGASVWGQEAPDEVPVTTDVIGESGGAAAGSNNVSGGGSTEYESDDDFNEPLGPGLVIRDSGSGSKLEQARRERKSVALQHAPSKTLSVAPETTDVYTVQDGDTLWDICDRSLGDSYLWPKIWSYNPTITNPHWIYPGDQVRLAPAAGELLQPLASNGPSPEAMSESGNTGLSRSAVISILRNKGFIDNFQLRSSGYISGAFKEAMLLSQFDEAYIKFPENKNVSVGQEYAVYHIIREVEPVRDIDTEIGYLVEVFGRVRIISYEPKTGIARGLIIEANQPIERGEKVGVIDQDFKLVPPVRNKTDKKGAVIAFLNPTVLAGEWQVIFVDIGKDDGVEIGNRIFVVKQRDQLREQSGKEDSDKGYPTEVIAEIRVIEVRPHTATCLVTRTVRELEVGNPVELRKGY